MLTIKTGNFQKNAGIVGLITILENSGFIEGADYIVESDRLLVSESVFSENDFGQMYMDTLLSKYRDTALTKWQNSVNMHRNTPFTSSDSDQKLLDDIRPIKRKKCWTIAVNLLPEEKAKKLADIANRTRSLGLLTSVENKKAVDACLEKFKMQKLPTKRKKDITIKEREELLYDMADWLNDPECFIACQTGVILQDVVTLFWKRKPLINPPIMHGGPVVSDDIIDCKGFAEAYNEAFTKKIVAYQPKEKYVCAECGGPIRKDSDSYPITFFNNVWSDFDRKTSIFWDCETETRICPICALVYSCAPIGFTQYGSDFLFINRNSDIRVLVSANSGNAPEKGDSKITQWFNRVVNALNKKTAEETLNQIQVIVLNGRNSRYSFYTINKYAAEVINSCSNSLEAFARNNVWIPCGSDNINVYEEVAQRIMNLADVKDLFYLCVTNNNLRGIEQILDIQASLSIIGRRMNMTKEEFTRKKKHAIMSGCELREKYLASKGTDNSNALNCIIYPLLNYIRNRDVLNMGLLLNSVYASLGLSEPAAITYMLDDTESAQIIGLLFVSGLLKEDDKTKNNNH